MSKMCGGCQTAYSVLDTVLLDNKLNDRIGSDRFIIPSFCEMTYFMKIPHFVGTEFLGNDNTNLPGGSSPNLSATWNAELNNNQTSDRCLDSPIF